MTREVLRRALRSQQILVVERRQPHGIDAPRGRATLASIGGLRLYEAARDAVVGPVLVPQDTKPRP